MKIKVRISEGYDTWIVKESIQIDTSLYPQLKDIKDKEQLLKYLQDNIRDIEYINPITKELEEGWSLFDEMYEQDTIRHKETNYETHVHIDNTEEEE